MLRWIKAIRNRLGSRAVPPRPDLSADDEQGTVQIGRLTLEGWLWPETPCNRCGHATVYDEQFDATLCPACDAWLDSQCSDTSCALCTRRPQPPLSGRP